MNKTYLEFHKRNLELNQYLKYMNENIDKMLKLVMIIERKIPKTKD